MCDVCGERVNESAHTYGDWKTDGVQHWKECTVCGAKTEAEAHEYDSDVWDSDGEKHWQSCSVCGFKVNEAVHEYNGNEWTGNETTHWNVCDVCGGRVNETAHTCNGDVWESSGATHWNVCDVCGERVNESAHTYGDWKTDGVQHWKECTVCGAKTEAEAHEYDSDVWDSDGEKHWQSCSVCGFKVNEAVHEYNGNEWTGNETTHWNVCDVCGGRVNETAHTCNGDVWESSGATHWNVCDVCGERVNESAHTYGGDGICTVCGYVKGEDDVIYGNKEDIAEAELSIHFIELGNKYTGDCTLIKVGDTEVLIDAGSRQNSAPAIKEYVDEYCTDGKLEYVIATHADQDHIAGMVGTKSDGEYNGILYSYDIGTIIKFDRSNKSDGSTTVYGKFLAGVEYARSQGSAVYTGLQCWNGTDGAQRTYYLDEEQTVSLNILYNYYYENKSSDENNYSVCFLLTQQTDDGEKNYLFTGDLEEEGEEYLVQYNQLPEVELFKAGHHGSPTSSNDVLLSVIKPKNIVVCCCCGSDEYTDNNANQFPSQAFINRAAMYTENIYCTTIVSDNEDGYASMNGDVVFYYDKAEGEQKGSLKLWCSADTTKLKYTDWFAANRTWPEGGV